jgi:hypothetical protein
LPGGSGEERDLLKALVAMLSIVGKFRNAWFNSKIQISPSGEWTVKHWVSDTGTHITTRYRFPKHGMPFIWHDDED